MPDTPLRTPFLGSTILRIYGLAKLQEPNITIEETLDEPSISLTSKLAEAGADCLRCYLVIDPRQFEESIADIFHFLRECTQHAPPFECVVGASLASASATQPLGIRIDTEIEKYSTIVSRSLFLTFYISFLFHMKIFFDRVFYVC